MYPLKEAPLTSTEESLYPHSLSLLIGIVACGIILVAGCNHTLPAQNYHHNAYGLRQDGLYRTLHQEITSTTTKP